MDPCSFAHAANGHDALESGSRGCAKGHDPIEVVVGDVWTSFLSKAESFSLSQAQTLWPQVGRFL